MKAVLLIRAGSTGGYQQEHLQEDETATLSDVYDCTGKRFVLLAEFGDELVAGF